MPVYLPPAFFWWWLLYDAYAPRVFHEGACIAASGGVMSAVAAFGLSIWRARDGGADTYGSARWAMPSEVRGASLLGKDGIVLGRYRDAYRHRDGPEHVLRFAPTRSAKGVGLVVLIPESSAGCRSEVVIRAARGPGNRPS
jgi:type IV secretion system protein VirD4